MKFEAAMKSAVRFFVFVYIQVKLKLKIAGTPPSCSGTRAMAVS